MGTRIDVRVGGQPIIPAKLATPDLPPGVVERPRINSRLEAAERIALLTAPPGYGKTVAARHYIGTVDAPVAWLSLDRFDHSAPSFWLHFTRSLRAAIPDLDDEAESALRAGVPFDRFLALLIAQVQRAPEPVTLVLDDLTQLAGRRAHAGIEALVERAGHAVRLVVTARSDPPFPLARWRANGWLVEIREEHLRLTTGEALAAAATFDGLAVSPDAVAALNGHVEGWPMGLHLALVASSEAVNPEDSAVALAGSDRLLADYVVAEVVDKLPARHRDIALRLSVVEWFDPDMCAELAGPGSYDVVLDLERRRLLLSPTADHPEGKRFHRLFRELLETELRWRDPETHVAMHRLAAQVRLRRGDLNAACRHLLTAGDQLAVNELIAEPVFRLAERGDRIGLSRMASSVPGPAAVDQPALALDVAAAWFFAGSLADATAWSVRAEELVAAASPVADRAALDHRLRSVRSLLALYAGDLEGAAAEVSGADVNEAPGAATPLGRQFPTVAARIALARMDLEAAERWLVRARGLSTSTAMSEVTVPALEAWYELLNGRIERATRLADDALGAAERAGPRPHIGSFDATSVAGWCRFVAGDLAGALEHARSAVASADELGLDWPRVRAAVAVARAEDLLHGPQAAITVLHHARGALHPGASPSLSATLDVAEARSLWRRGRWDAARDRLGPAGSSPPAQLLRAQIALSSLHSHDVPALLGASATWTPVMRLAAEVLLAAADTTGAAVPRMGAALEEGALNGWVSPFLGNGPRVDDLLRQLPLDRLHPSVQGFLVARPGESGRASLVHEVLTAREMTVLALLPTHLSYAQIGAELHLSVNTVKSNLKSIYRKLAVANRSEAIDTARVENLL